MTTPTSPEARKAAENDPAEPLERIYALDQELLRTKADWETIARKFAAFSSQLAGELVATNKKLAALQAAHKGLREERDRLAVSASTWRDLAHKGHERWLEDLNGDDRTIAKLQADLGALRALLKEAREEVHGIMVKSHLCDFPDTGENKQFVTEINATACFLLGRMQGTGTNSGPSGGKNLPGSREHPITPAAPAPPASPAP